MKEINESYFIESKGQDPTTIDSQLSNDETILWRGKPKKSSYVLSAIVSPLLPFVILWLAFDVAMIVIMALNGSAFPAWIWVFIALFFAFHLLPVWMWIINIIKANIEHKNIDYAFTNKRIITRRGIVGIDIRNIYYSDIESVNLKVGIIDKMFKVGDIYIKAKAESVVLFDIENPYVIINALQKIALDIKSDIIFPNALRPAENTGYKTDYKPEKEKK